MKGAFDRSLAVLGEEGFRRLVGSSVIIFGVGGVGSWCAEALIRTGLCRLTIVDDDVVDVTNINRQLPATAKTVGETKVVALGRRLREINPNAEITELPLRYRPSDDTFTPDFLSGFDYIIDAIDSTDSKFDLLDISFANGFKVFSSMGAALRLDPTKVRVAPFSKVAGDGLARALRMRFKKKYPVAVLPDFPCVFTEESPQKLPMLGSIICVTATFGLTLASLVIDDATRRV